MDNHNHVNKFCVVCVNEQVFNEYQRFHKPYKICVAISSARYYQAENYKIIANSKLYQTNTKSVKKHLKHIKQKRLIIG